MNSSLNSRTASRYFSIIDNYDAIFFSTLKIFIIFISSVYILGLSGLLNNYLIAALYVFILSALVPELGAALTFSSLFLGQTFLRYLNTVNHSPIINLETFVAAGVFVNIFWTLYQKDRMILRRSIVIVLIVAAPVIAAIISLLLRFDLGYYFKYVVVYQTARGSILAIILSALIFKDSQRILRFFFNMFLLGALLSITVLMFNYSINWHVANDYLRLLGANEESVIPIEMGRKAGLAVVIGLFLYIRSKNWLMKYFVLALSTVSLAANLFANEKGPILGLVIAILYAVLSMKSSVKTNLKYYVSIFFFFIIISFFLREAINFISQMGFRMNPDELLHSGNSRTTLIIQGLISWWNNPFIGVGIRGMSVSSWYAVYPHNVFVDILVSGGIAGAMASIPMFSSIYKFITLKFFFPEKTFYITLFIFTLFNANVSGDLVGNRMFFATAVLLVLHIQEISGYYYSRNRLLRLKIGRRVNFT